MRASLVAFNKEIADLLQQIESLELQWDIFKSKVQNQAPSEVERKVAALVATIGSGLFRRRFEYNSIVVTLYGLFEQFIESLIESYLRKLNELVPSYGELPAKILNAHIELTSALLAKPDLQKFRGVISQNSLVANLHSCLSGALGYRLNAEAFTYHTANFRSDVIEQALGKIGISGISNRIRVVPIFRDFIQAKYPERLENGFAGDLFHELNDLAERRNEVSHCTPTQTLASDILVEYVQYIQAYANALTELVASEFLSHEVMMRGKNLGRPIALYNNKIVCFDLTQAAVKVGDRIIARTNDDRLPYVGGQVIRIEVNGAAQGNLTCQSAQKVGLEVDFRAGHFNYFLLEPEAIPWAIR
jgi:hypothetical protein